MISDGVVALRPATAADAPLLVAGRDELAERFLGPGDVDPRPAHVVVVDGEVVGWVDLDADRPWLEPEQVNVGYLLFPQHRGRGYATRAVRLLVEELAAAGREATFLVDPGNERSLALVARLGIAPAGEVDGQLRFVGPLYGRWAPLSLPELRRALEGAPFRWWLTGGVALELHVGGSWRDHADLDVGICRADAPALFAQLRPWSACVAARGCLRPWDGRTLLDADGENNVWWRRDPEGPWILDTAVGAGDDREWVYRRDPEVRRPWSDAVLVADDGTPYLAPELQLLFTSKGLRAKDQLDAEVVVPALSTERRAALQALLPAGHPWQALAAQRRAR